MAAAHRGSLAVARLLLEHGADRTAVDDEGKSASDVAEEWAARDIETYLRSHLEQVAGSGEEIETKRTQLPDGTELVEVRLVGRSQSSLETGHSRIAELLRAP
jgi:hypothetical protein